MTAPSPSTRPRDGGHRDWDALAVGWALSTLDSPDEARFARHLPGCEWCAATVRESLHTVADLAYALPDQTPPPPVKVRIVAAVRAEPRRRPDLPVPPPAAGEADRLRPAPGTRRPDTDWFARPRPRDASPPAGDPPQAASTGGMVGAPASRPSRTGRLRDPEPDPPTLEARPEPAVPGPATPPAVEEAAAGDSPVRPEGRGRHASLDEDTSSGIVVPFERPAWHRWARWAAAAAVVALLAALVAWNVRLRADQDQLRQVVAGRSAEVARRDTLVAQRDATIRQLTTNTPARVAALVNPKEPTRPRRATIVVSGDRIEIIIETLGASAADTTYWLWTLRCDQAAPSDLKPIQGFTVAGPQFSVRDIGSDPGFASATCFAISKEIGTARPTAPGEVVAVGQPE
ncbi:MAG: hypothetical protein ACJ73E_18240 [Mycobacteriales bacterium]